MILKLIIQRLKMVLREFSEDELEMFFTDKHLRQVLIMLIQEYGNSLSSDAIINLALQNLLGDLQMNNDPQLFWMKQKNVILCPIIHSLKNIF